MLVVALLIGIAIALDRAYPPKVWLSNPSTGVLDRDGGLLRLYPNRGGYWRLPARLERLDRRFVAALLAYEDGRYYRHPGVDPLALLRAAGQWLWHGRVLSGGSTLTMQLVRLMEPRPRTVWSKLLESLRALQLETRLSKDAILARYLTLAPYGGNLQGVRAASLFYFGKEPEFLTLDQAALLVALPQSPERRRPDRHPRAARQARDAVVERLFAAGMIDAGQLRDARRRPVPRRRIRTPRQAPHLGDRLRGEHPHRRRFRTTLDGPLQRRLEDLVRPIQAGLADGLAVAVLVVDNRDASVVGYVGSGDFFSGRVSGQLDMVRAIRSPGSTLKPLVYGLAFDSGMIHPETLIDDRAAAVDGYAPGNFDHRYRGEISVREALQGSRNLPAVRVLRRLRPARLLAALQRVGLRPRLPKSPTRPGLPIALGGLGLSLEQLASLYAALAGRGEVRRLRLLVDDDPSPPRRLLSSVAAWYLTDILQRSPLPAGHAPGREFAFKTGTSYGYRDAWAIGYDADHTVAVWIGRPDGGYTAELSGLGSAAPLMLAVADQLSSRGLQPLLSDRPAGVLRVANSQLPVHQRRFSDTPGGARGATLGSGRPRIAYPPAGAAVLLGRREPLRFVVNGGQGPYHWLVDGRLIGGGADGSLDWSAQQPGRTAGRHRVSVVDRRGRSDAHSFSVRWNGD